MEDGLQPGQLDPAGARLLDKMGARELRVGGEGGPTRAGAGGGGWISLQCSVIYGIYIYRPLLRAGRVQEAGWH